MVESRDKCLFVAKADGRVDADVVPAMQLRKYTDYPAAGEPRFVEGIRISPLSGGQIVNYPKEHKENGILKNKACGERYKETVRQVKRLRRLVVESGKLSADDAPGYLVECLTYNVPRQQFVVDDVERLRKVMAYLSVFSPEELAAKFNSCDEIHTLFHSDPGQHNQYTAKRVIDAMWDAL